MIMSDCKVLPLTGLQFCNYVCLGQQLSFCTNVVELVGCASQKCYPLLLLTVKTGRGLLTADPEWNFGEAQRLAWIDKVIHPTAEDNPLGLRRPQR